MRLEKRVRVEVFIPLRENDLAYQAVSQWVAEEFAFQRGGSTATTAFIGLYASQATGRIVRDHVQIIFTELSSPRYIPHMLSKSQFNRRLHQITDLFLQLFFALGQVFKQFNTSSEYVIDSFPVAVCDNIRISRNKIYG